MRRIFSILAALALAAGNVVAQAPRPVTLLNVSYDPTRELYEEYNAAFARHWKAQTGQTVTVRQSHGGSGAQSRAVQNGLQADVVTLGLAYDIDALYNNGKLVQANWQQRLPDNSSPYTSTVVFLVRRGNPKNIRDWADLVRPGVAVITSNPKTSGGGRWAYLAAWGYALRANNRDQAKARDYVQRLYRNVPVLDSGARGSTTTFIERGIGDVLIAWENEALLAMKQYGNSKYELVAPSVSILAEPPVTIVDRVVNKRGTKAVAAAYVNYLYSEEGQNIAAKWFYRPRNAQVAARFANQFPRITLFKLEDYFTNWATANRVHFSDGGMYDQISRPT
jgi:sulfate/thiosulfate transport system substrate-binding protein